MNSLGQDITGRVVVLRENAMAPEYRDLKWRLFMAEGGFGCRHDTMGTAVIGYHLHDKERARWHGSLLERFATDEDLAVLGQEVSHG